MQKIKKGDNVEVILGKDRGKSGAIDRILMKEGLVYISGVNTVKRHVKSQQGIEGGIIDIIKPMKVSNVMLVCPNCKKATRVGFKLEGTEKVRFCKKCQKVIGGKK